MNHAKSHTTSSQTRTEQAAALVDTLYSLTIDNADYDDFIQSWGEVSDSWITELSVNAGHRSEREQQALLEHFQRAEQIILRIGRNAENPTDLKKLVEVKSHPALVVDLSGTIVASNTAFAHLHEGDLANLNFADLMHQLMGGADKAFAANTSGMSEFEQSKLVLVNDEPCLLISTPTSDGQHTLVDFSRASWHDDLESDLRTIFALSRSEVSICHLLYEGYEVKEIAELRCRAEDTVRKQIKSIHIKTRCSRQAEFMRLLTGMLVMGQMGRPEIQVDSRLVNRQNLRLPDGRGLAYFVLSPEKAIRHTVVITHGIASSPIFPQPFFDTLLEHGIAIVGVSRPGYGRSTPLPAKTNPLDQFALDLTQLLDHLGLQQVSLVSMQSGAMFSFAAEAELAHRVDRIACIAPLMPLFKPEEIAGLPIGLKILARTKKFFPSFFPLVLQTLLKRIDAGEVDSLYRSWYKGVPCDLAVLDDPAAHQLLDSWLRFCGAQGSEPYSTDAGFVLSDWSALVSNCSTQALFIHGAEDQTVSRASIERYTDQHAHLELEILPSCGQLMIMSEPQRIAQIIVNFLQ